MDVVRLMLIGEHRMLTEALADEFSTREDVWVVGQSTTDAADLETTARRLRPDVITFEVDLLNGPVTRLLRRVAVASPGASLVVLTADQDTAHAVAAVRAGVVAWVAKDQPLNRFVDVACGAARGESWFSPRILGAVLRSLREDGRRDAGLGTLEVLTRREREVLMRMVEGKGSGTIAAELRIAPDTVRTHSRSILSKLEVHSRLEAVSTARLAGWRPDGPDRFAEHPLPAPRRDPAGPV
jgi:two-component system nitrate/nitrite response regulator NarL